jgi:hypothetical protein
VPQQGQSSIHDNDSAGAAQRSTRDAVSSTQKTTAAQLTAPCATCPFTSSASALRLQTAQIDMILNLLFSPAGGTFLCHSTADRDADGNLTADRVAPCAGAVMFREKCAEGNPLLHLLGSHARGAVDLPKLRGWDRIKSTITELFASARPDDGPYHPAYRLPEGGSLERIED